MEYRENPAWNYSMLKAFYQSPEHVFLKKADTKELKLGRLFETLLIDKAWGIDMLSESAAISENYDKRTKAGKECAAKFEAENIDKLILTQDEFDLLINMVNHTLKLTFQPFSEFSEKWTIEQLILEGKLKQQIYWEDRQNKKKAEIDLFCKIDVFIFPFDFKTYSTGSFEYAIKNLSYWIQDIHYCEGLSYIYPEYVISPMTFIACNKEDPILPKCWQLDVETRKYAKERYERLVDDFAAWDASGRQRLGYDPELGKASFFIK